MKLKQLLTDRQAVSPVIGVILMVAITVILAAVIGTFVLGLGDQVSEQAPQAQLDFTYDTSVSPTQVTITHVGGDQLDNSSIEVVGTTTPGFGDGDYVGGTYSAGSNIFTGVEVSGGETLRIIWTNPSGGSTQTIAESTVPN